ncbi:helix-turn-helix domain-containing protein [Corynebacterium gallinarum]|uniref:helix-turn-helix domain-containing protein n=1 Tax=Corynebacterium gallinarum TaxID=2762214 RepID=UPI001CD9100A|nr:helix-turn-helix domain-containing protein [Corynebacterium gallinarum]
MSTLNAETRHDRARGRVGGRPPLLSGVKLRTARKLYEQKDMTVEQIGKVLGVSRTTVYRALRKDTGALPERQKDLTPVW